MTQGAQSKPQDHEERKQFVHDKITSMSKYLSMGMSITSSARAAGLHPNTYYDWKRYAKEGKEPYASIWDKVHSARAKGEAVLVHRIHRASEVDWKAASWLLERAYKQDWSLKFDNTQNQEQPKIEIVMPEENDGKD